MTTLRKFKIDRKVFTHSYIQLLFLEYDLKIKLIVSSEQFWELIDLQYFECDRYTSLESGDEFTRKQLFSIVVGSEATSNEVNDSVQEQVRTVINFIKCASTNDFDNEDFYIELKNLINK